MPDRSLASRPKTSAAPQNPAPRARRNIAREVALALRTDIISGRLRPGSPLAEPVLAKLFGSSRAPIREALIELEREGLVQFQTTGRTKVRSFTETDFAEIRDARVALESMAARRAAENWTPADTAFIDRNIEAQSKASTLAELSRLDIELHEYVMKHSDNKRLLALWQSVRWQFEMCLATTHRLQQKLAFKPRNISVVSHRRLLAALASGKPALAAETMASHIEGSMEWSSSYHDSDEDKTPSTVAAQATARP
jgi:DNA-binding GntR family transcriptional regulator